MMKFEQSKDFGIACLPAGRLRPASQKMAGQSSQRQ